MAGSPRPVSVHTTNGGGPRHDRAVTVESLCLWVADELAASGLPADHAIGAASAVVERSRANPVQAAMAVSVARALARLPEGAGWWNRSDLWAAQARELLLAGDPDVAFAAIGEKLAEAASDTWDPNWPSAKVAWALLPDHPHVGQTFLVGNGEGGRATVKVVDRDGRLEAVITSATSTLDDLREEGLEQAERLLSD
jgi:hypothetical protein